MIQCNDYLRSDQAQQDLTLFIYLFIYYAIRQHKNTQNTHYTRKKSTLIKNYKKL